MNYRGCEYEMRRRAYWHRKVPYDVMVAQARWDLCMLIRRARKVKPNKIPFRVIDEMIGAYGRGMSFNISRSMRIAEIAPVEVYFNQKADLVILCGNLPPPAEHVKPVFFPKEY